MRRVLSFLLFASVVFADANPEQKKKPWFFNICWECAFPFHIAGHNLSSQEDFASPKKKWICTCGEVKIFGVGTFIPKVVGMPLAFWEPQGIVEVTRHPFRFKLLEANSANPKTYRNVGGVSNSDAGRSSFYNVHYYAFPVFRLAFIIPGFTCMRNADISTPVFLTEWSPFWNDMGSNWHWIVDPLRFIYATPRLQELCKRDCEAAIRRKPSDSYPWCAGCLGSLYPFTGHVGYHIGGIQASSLLLCRMVGLFHTAGAILDKLNLNVFGIGMGFENDNFCSKTASSRLKKTIYKTQLLSPVPDDGSVKNGMKIYCRPLGDSGRDWGGEHTYPIDGEDFTYILWTKMHCCYDFLDIVKKTVQWLELLPSGDDKTNEKLKSAKGVLDEIESKIKEYSL